MAKKYLICDTEIRGNSAGYWMAQLVRDLVEDGRVVGDSNGLFKLCEEIIHSYERDEYEIYMDAWIELDYRLEGLKFRDIEGKVFEIETDEYGNYWAIYRK